MDRKFEGGMFGGIPKPIGWDIDQMPSFEPEGNPFFERPRYPQPSKPIAPEARATLNSAMTDWYKAGKPSPFKNVDDVVAQRLSGTLDNDGNFVASPETGAKNGVNALLSMSFPGLNMAALAKVPPSENIEDRRPKISDRTWSKIESYNNTQDQPNQLDNIIAGFNAPGGPTQPILSVPASGRLYKAGDDPFAELSTQRGSFNPLDMMLGLIGGRGAMTLSKPVASPVKVQAGGPGFSVNANTPVDPFAASLSRSNSIWNTANEGGSLPTRVMTDNAIAAEKAQMSAPSGEVVPFRKNMPKGNIRAKTEEEVLAAIESQWDKMVQSGIPTTAPNNQLIQILRGLTEKKP